MVLVGRIQRYILRECMIAMTMTLGVIVMAIVLVDVVEQMRDVGSRTQIGVVGAFRLSLLHTPTLILETLPFAVLVGSIMTFSQLSRRSEIPAIRAAGVSAWRFLGPAIALAGFIGVLMVTVIDPLATRLNQQFEAERERLLNPRTGGSLDGGAGVWLSQSDVSHGVPGASENGSEEGQAIIHANHVVGRAEALEGVTFYYFGAGPGGPDDRVFTHRIDAKRAELHPDFWQLTGVVENRTGGETHRQESLALPTNLRPDALLSRFASSETIPFWELPSFIAESRSAGMEVDAYVLKLHVLLATPLFMVAMALIGAVVCLRLSRAGGLSQLIGAGAVCGFVLYFVNRIAEGMAKSGATPPEAAAWCPPLFALFAVLTVLAHAEDG
jgi:lipopolysaccharide export system permease protein